VFFNVLKLIIGRFSYFFKTYLLVELNLNKYLVLGLCVKQGNNFRRFFLMKKIFSSN
jgi:hypothetical protein